MQDFEKFGVFYLGKDKLSSELLLYESKNLTTHAVCVGMTGSGKTGLGIALLEEAAMDKIPAIIIDPKGDMGDLLLSFPDQTPEEFLPWIDQAEAERQNLSPQQYAQQVAKTWAKGLAKWDESTERIKKMRNNVDIAIYTPGSQAGIPISILNSFSAPPKEIMLDKESLHNRSSSLVSSILGLLGIDADPLKSKEHILLSTLINNAWEKGIDLDITTLIQQVLKPPVSKIGALDVNTFFSQKELLALSISLNNLLASPAFQRWMEGDPLNIKQLLYNKEGKPKLSIISIAHLNDSERMFFVTLLLNEFIIWMRQQSGTSSLRALLYMDEIFGYFPPVAIPPSKIPMLTLLKQARAFGVGVVLATQNPADLDYKGLSNCGTWFIGKLQTERDKARVIEGLKASFKTEELDKLLTLTGNRVFILHSIYETSPTVFETRWTMSYLCGPLTLTQIQTAMKKPAVEPKEKTKVKIKPAKLIKPQPPSGIAEFFLPNMRAFSQVLYKPYVMGVAKLHFIDAKNEMDTWRTVCIMASASEDGRSVLWDEGKCLPDVRNKLERNPLPESSFAELVDGLVQEKKYKEFEKTLVASLYQNQTLSIYKSGNLTSAENESEGDFRIRLFHAMREQRDETIKKLNEKYASKIKALTNKLQRAQQKLAQQQQSVGIQKTETMISVGSTLLGAIFGRKITKGTINQAGSSIRKAGRVSKKSQSANQIERDVHLYQQQLDELQTQLKNEVNQINFTDPNSISVKTITIRPRKSDISIEQIALVWEPTSLSS